MTEVKRLLILGAGEFLAYLDGQLVGRHKVTDVRIALMEDGTVECKGFPGIDVEVTAGKPAVFQLEFEPVPTATFDPPVESRFAVLKPDRKGRAQWKNEINRARRHSR